MASMNGQQDALKNFLVHPNRDTKFGQPASIHCSAMSIGCCIAVAGADSARQSHLRRQTNPQRAPRDGAATSSPPTQLDLATPVKIDKSVGVCQRSPVSVTARAVTSHAHELMNTSGLRRPL